MMVNVSSSTAITKGYLLELVILSLLLLQTLSIPQVIPTNARAITAPIKYSVKITIK